MICIGKENGCAFAGTEHTNCHIELTLPQDYSYIDEILDKLLAGRDINHSRPKTSKTQAKHSIIKAIEAEVEQASLLVNADAYGKLSKKQVKQLITFHKSALETLEQHLKRKEEK